MKKFSFVALMVFAMVIGFSVNAGASSITPQYTTFGTLAGATFGGSGIPNDAVAITTINLTNGDVITMGLTAHERFANPAVDNDGAGTFSAIGGGDMTSAPTASCPVPSNCAPWNWAFYISVTGNNMYQFQIQHEYDPGITDESALSVIQFTMGQGVVQDSLNQEFAFLSGGLFDPNVAGHYSFRILAAPNVRGVNWDNPLGSVAINVTTGDFAPVPEPGTWMMMGTGLALIASRIRRRKNKA